MTMIEKRGDWLAAKVGDELVMMNPEKGEYIGLSEVGARIWELVDAQPSLDELCLQLQKEYDVPADICQAEVERFLAELVKHDAVRLDAAPVS
jgi:hypothetical protein